MATLVIMYYRVIQSEKKKYFARHGMTKYGGIPAFDVLILISIHKIFICSKVFDRIASTGKKPSIPLVPLGRQFRT